MVRNLPTEAGGLEVPGGGFGLAERTKDEAARSFHVVSVGDDWLTSGAVVVDVESGVLGVGVGVVFGNLRHNGASCCAARQPGGARTLPLRRHGRVLPSHTSPDTRRSGADRGEEPTPTRSRGLGRTWPGAADAIPSSPTSC